MKQRSTHLLFEPGEGFEYGWSIYMVQLLVERLGGKDKYVQYANENMLKPLSMTSSTFIPDLVPDIWARRLQMVQRIKRNSDDDPRFEPKDEVTRGLTCSLSDIARIFGDILSPECKLLKLQAHRDMLFEPQLEPGSVALQAMRAGGDNYGYLLPFTDDSPSPASLALSPPPAVNWTLAGTFIEEDDALPGTGLPKGTVAFEGFAKYYLDYESRKGNHGDGWNSAAAGLGCKGSQSNEGLYLRSLEGLRIAIEPINVVGLYYRARKPVEDHLHIS